MKKIYSIISLLALCSIILTSCGTIKSDTSSNSPSENVNTDSPVSSNIKESSNSEENNKVTEEPIEQKKIALSRKQAYVDSEREISILGLKEYKKLKGERFTDKAPKGKKYLVLFLKVKNCLTDKDYFNVNNLSAELDGKEIENTFLLNDPEGYPTIFSNIEPETSIGGFIVWEVPEDWKKLDVIYTGWQPGSGLTLECSLTKKDLKKPEKYNKNDYY